jgi:UDP-2,3-diacylglucosamine pyrophosphatase LpxH
LPKITIDYISDLHIETRPNSVGDILQAFASLEKRGQYCVLAGDISPMVDWQDENGVCKLIKALCSKYEQVFYCVGNHELYQAHQLAVYHNPSNFCHRLNNQTVGTRTGLDWYNKLTMPSLYTKEYIGKRAGALRTWETEGVIFYVINEWYALPPNYPQVRINDARQITNLRIEYEELTKHLKEGADFAWQRIIESSKEHPTHKKVVVSHYLPHQKSIHHQFKNSSHNAYFLVDRTAEIEEAGIDLFIHGHTHLPISYKLGKIKVVANPLGYPFEGNELVVKQISI